MKLATFRHEGLSRLGVVEGEEVVDLGSVVPEGVTSMAELLARAEEGLAAARKATSGRARRIPRAEVCLQAPVLRPSKFLAIGLNYEDHLAETGRDRPATQIWFNKQVSCIVGPYDPVELPRVSSCLDYEGELGFVIGRRCRHVPAGLAPRVIAGYLIVNDFSIRDWQARSPTMTMGKSFDTHGPVGPWLVTADEIGDPHRLDLRTYVNGELRQNSNTAMMIFNCFEMVAHLTAAFTLEPGDIISTGTPAGVGGFSDPPRYLRAGDVVRVEIDGIGHIENRIVEESEAVPRSE